MNGINGTYFNYSKLGVATTQETEHIQTVQVLEAKLVSCDREITEQQSKKERALAGVKRYAKILRTTQQTFPKATSDEEDFLIRNLRDIGTVVLTELNKLMIKEPELVVPIKTLMLNLGINAPSRAISRVSSRASSDRGDWSQPHSRSSSRATSYFAIVRAPSVSRISGNPTQEVPPLLPRTVSKPQVILPSTNISG